MIFVILIVCGAAALLWYVHEKIKAYSVRAVLIKAVVSFFFVAVGVFGLHALSVYGETNPVGVLIVLGLVCGLLGDIWLDLKYVFPEKDRVFTYAGFGAFGVGHVFYIGGMLVKYYTADAYFYVLVAFILAIVVSIGNAALEKPMKLSYGDMKLTVIIYGILLFATLFVSGALALAYGWREVALNLLFAGAVLFTASDLVLSKTYFGEGHERPIDFILNYFTYYPAQFLIASSLMFM